MKFKVNRDYFYQAISEVSRIVPSKANSPILVGIKIVAHSEGLTLAVSNHDLFIEKKLPPASSTLEVYKAGSVVISAKYLIELVKKMPSEITVSMIEGNRLTIQTTEITIKLSLFDTTDYPYMPEMTTAESFKLRVNLLNEMIKQTSFAVSQNDSRQVLTGLLLSFQPNKLTCAATNSHRLALREEKMDTGIEGAYIVPLNSIKEFIRLFSNSFEEITVYASDRFLVFKSHNITLYTRLIEGNYPNLSGLIPEESKTTITISKNRLLEGIDRAYLFAKVSRNNNVKLEMIDERGLLISSYSTDLGKIEELQQLESISGEKKLVISLDGSFMLDALKAINEELVSLSFSGSMRPVMIQPVGSSTHKHLISPVRT